MLLLCRANSLSAYCQKGRFYFYLPLLIVGNMLLNFEIREKLLTGFGVDFYINKKWKGKKVEKNKSQKQNKENGQETFFSHFL